MHLPGVQISLLDCELKGLNFLSSLFCLSYYSKAVTENPFTKKNTHAHTTERKRAYIKTPNLKTPQKPYLSKTEENLLTLTWYDDEMLMMCSHSRAFHR